MAAPIWRSHTDGTEALHSLAQWCLPAAYPMLGEPSRWWEACDDVSRLWASMLLDQVTLIDRIDWITAQQDLMGIPVPEAATKPAHNYRARPDSIACPICADHGFRSQFASPAHVIIHIYRHHSVHWTSKPFAKYLHKCNIRMLMNYFRNQQL